MTGLLANDAEYAANAAAGAAHAVLAADDASAFAEAVRSVAADAVMAVVEALSERSGMDIAAANADLSSRERAWQAERLAALESDWIPIAPATYRAGF